MVREIAGMGRVTEDMVAISQPYLEIRNAKTVIWIYPANDWRDHQ
jgi:hypothetical protein